MVHLPKRPRKVPVERHFCSGKKELLSSFSKDTDIVFPIVFYFEYFPAPADVKILDSKPRFREFKKSYHVYNTNENLSSSRGGEDVIGLNGKAGLQGFKSIKERYAAWKINFCKKERQGLTYR
ncbi:MAG: hypothetical protein GU362_05605 [Thaumarchaeota archaeon]|jgi:hypothetical protein|nr:hypothetical protein [Nitrososphaerota archaeon]